MTVTVIKESYTVKQILLGEITQQTKDWVDQLNNNPLIESNWTHEEQYINKSIHDIKEFFNIE